MIRSRRRWSLTLVAFVGLVASMAAAQRTDDPFPVPLEESAPLLFIGVQNFVVLPEFEGEAARMMLMVEEPGTGRLFVNDMRGLLYVVREDGSDVHSFLNVFADEWQLDLLSDGGERGFHGFAFHPQFAQPDTAGFGKLYTSLDTQNTAPVPDFGASQSGQVHDTIVLEWTTPDPLGSIYLGSAPREVLRIRRPVGGRNAAQIGFNPVATPGSADYGLLFVGSAAVRDDARSTDSAQDSGSIFGKILRIDPLGSSSRNGKYGHVSDNPFAHDGDETTLAEIFAVGVRDLQGFSWDSMTGSLFVADSGHGVVEEISVVTTGANLGWSEWQGSYRHVTRDAVSLSNPRGAVGYTYPVAEYGHRDPLLQGAVSVAGVVVYRDDAVPQLENLVLFGDHPSGELFVTGASALAGGGQEAIQRVVLRTTGGDTALLSLVQEANRRQGRPPAAQARLRFGRDRAGRVFLLNAHDGTIRVLVADSSDEKG